MPSEFSLIDAFLAAFPKAGKVAEVLPGDDCAVLPPSAESLCVTTDALVQDVHFSLPAFSLPDVGHKALAVNLSDLAAMGATPRWFLCAIAMPKSYGLREVRALAKGMAALAVAHRIALVGGNFTAAGELSITLTAAGSCPKGRALTRAGAKAGDLLYVSGTLGDARAGLQVLQQRNAPGSTALPVRHARALSGRQRRPTPRVALGLLARRFASAAVDVSDGLAQDLGHLCAASRVGASVQLGQLPLSPELPAWAGSTEAAWREAVQGGEDYELLLAVPANQAKAFERAAARKGERITRIGELERAPGLRLLAPDGTLLPAPGGHDHFRFDPRLLHR